MRFLISVLVVCLTLLLVMDKACAQKESQSGQDILEYLKSYPQAYELVQLSKLNEAIAELSKHALDNEGNAIFYNLLGLLQTKQRDHTAAAISFERVVLIEPNNAGAWLDLAIASLESGNIISASSYFDYIDANFTPPPALQKMILSYRKRIELRQKVDRKWRFTSEAIVGYDSNANSGLQVAVIPVTFGTDRVELKLDPKYQARGDQFTQLLAGSQFHQNYTSFGVDIGMSVKLRNYRTEHNFSSTEFASNIGILRPSNFGMMSLTASVDHSVLASKSLLNNMRITGSIERNQSDCRYGGGLEFELRRYIQLSELNANTTWLHLGGACDLRVWSRPTRAAFVLRTGRDVPTANRAGGQTIKQDLILQLGTFFTPQWRLDLSFHMSNGQDDDGYSALLENNAPRYLRRNIVRAQLSYPFDSDLDLFLRLDDNKIRSNIPLFIQSGKTASFGLQKRF